MSTESQQGLAPHLHVCVLVFVCLCACACLWCTGMCFFCVYHDCTASWVCRLSPIAFELNNQLFRFIKSWTGTCCLQIRKNCWKVDLIRTIKHNIVTADGQHARAATATHERMYIYFFTKWAGTVERSLQQQGASHNRGMLRVRPIWLETAACDGDKIGEG